MAWSDKARAAAAAARKRKSTPSGQYTKRGLAAMAKASRRVKKHENRLEKAFKVVDAGRTTKTFTGAKRFAASKVKLKSVKKLAWDSRMAVSRAYKLARYGSLARK